MKALIYLLATIISTYSGVIEAQNQKSPIRIAFTFSMPPYLNEDHNSGIELDIIRSALKEAGYNDISVSNVHYLRAIKLAKSNNVDLIVSNKMNKDYEALFPQGYSSKPTIHYVDCAISLKEKGITLSQISDYASKRIWAFKSASQTLGEHFFKMTQTNPNYTEEFDQEKQLEMLAMGRIDIAISDRNIFTAQLRSTELYRNTKLNFDTLGTPTPRSVRSTNKKLIEEFNKGLQAIHENGLYEDTLASYKDGYKKSCDEQ